jgi:hypothetical protein
LCHTGTIATFAEVPGDVLILGGSKGMPFPKPALDALARILPRNQRVEFPGLEAASDRLLVRNCGIRGSHRGAPSRPAMRS